MNRPHRLRSTRRLLHVRLAVGLVCCLPLMMSAMGCGSRAHQPVQTALVPFTPEQQDELARARAAEYRLRPGDRLAIDFKYLDNLNRSNLLVMPDGRLTPPGGIGPIMAGGLSIAQLDSALFASYAQDYRYPELSVIVESLADLEIYVLGRVRNPGRYILPAGGMGVMQAIAAAGGFNEDARPSQAVVMRVTSEGFVLRQLDLSHLQRRGFLDLADLDLRPFDVVYVPRSAAGDFKYFSDTILSGMLSVSRIFWDIYAISNLHKVTSVWR